MKQRRLPTFDGRRSVAEWEAFGVRCVTAKRKPANTGKVVIITAQDRALAEGRKNTARSKHGSSVVSKR